MTHTFKRFGHSAKDDGEHVAIGVPPDTLKTFCGMLRSQADALESTLAVAVRGGLFSEEHLARTRESCARARTFANDLERAAMPLRLRDMRF